MEGTVVLGILLHWNRINEALHQYPFYYLIKAPFSEVDHVEFNLHGNVKPISACRTL